MKIIHIANFYGPKSGGIKTTLHSLGTEYGKIGHDFIYVVPGKKFSRERTDHGGCITLPSWVIPFSGGYRVIRSTRQVKTILQSLKPDRLEVSDRFTLSCLGNWAKNRNIPAIVFSHETLRGLVKNYFGISLKSFVGWHNSRLAGKFDYVVTTTKFASDEFTEIGTSNVVRVPLGVDLETFSPAHRNEELRAKMIKGGDVLLVHCGRLSPEKKPERSLQVLRELLNRGVNARLVFIGSGPLHKKLYDSSRDIPVTFWGYVANKNLLAQMIASADVSIAPGPIETFCLAALESLASGTPVVASETSAVGEFLTQENGDFVGLTAANNGAAFADAVQIILDEIREDRTLTARCRQQAEQFPWSKTINRLENINSVTAA
ncbi:MAG: glycosyltransferase [Actinobacteria bacterium]|nr:glycosyltransferase [Actinomycetota bacterium]